LSGTGDEATEVGAIRSDNPITTTSEDLLKRATVAEGIADDMRLVDASQGYVTALMGPWGAGKTSLVNLVKEYLAQHPVLPVVDFNPWMFSGTDDLVSTFFREITGQLSGRDGDRYGAVVDQLDRYSELLTPLIWLPVLGPWAGRLKSLSSSLTKFRELRKGSATETKRAVSEALSKLDEPIVVVIDDIDRLSRQEIQDIFKLVRLTANFPNIIYLLVFDRVRVEEALSADGMPGRSYLEKIVQSGLDLPAVPRGILADQLAEELTRVTVAVGDVNRFNAALWPDVMAEIVIPFIKNMRDVRRFATSIRPTLAAMREQVELVDVLALEAIRVFLPDVFLRLATVRESLTTTASYGYGGTEPPALKAGVESLLEISGGNKALVKNLLRRMFPASIRHFENNNYGSDWLRTWLRERRVAHPDVLQLYLERTLSDGLASFAIAEHAYELLEDGDAFRAFLEELPPASREEVIHALETFEGDFPDAGIVPGVTCLLNVLPSIPERPRGMFSLDKRKTVSRVVYRMLKQLGDDQAAHEQAVDKILPNLEFLSSKLELLLTVGHIKGAGHKFISEERAAQLQKELADEVMAASAEDLAREENLLRLLRAPANWGSSTLRTIDAGAPLALHYALFRSALGHMTSQSMGSRHVQRTQTLAWDALTATYGDEVIIAAVLTRMNAQPEPDSEELRTLIQAYLDGWRHEQWD
jgi:KAP family P-loop domain